MLHTILKSVAHHFETCGTSFWNLPKSGQEQKYVKKKFISINKGIYCMANCADYKKTIMVCNGILWLELLDFLGYGTFSLMPWGINVWHGIYGISRNLYWLHLGLSQMTARALASLALPESNGTISRNVDNIRDVNSIIIYLCVYFRVIPSAQAKQAPA